MYNGLLRRKLTNSSQGQSIYVGAIGFLLWQDIRGKWRFQWEPEINRNIAQFQHWIRRPYINRQSIVVTSNVPIIKYTPLNVVYLIHQHSNFNIYSTLPACATIRHTQPLIKRPKPLHLAISLLNEEAYADWPVYLFFINSNFLTSEETDMIVGGIAGATVLHSMKQSGIPSEYDDSLNSPPFHWQRVRTCPPLTEVSPNVPTLPLPRFKPHPEEVVDQTPMVLLGISASCKDDY